MFACSVLALFQGLPAIQFLITYTVCKNRGEQPGPLYHMNDVSVYERKSLRPYLVISTQSAEHLWFRSEKRTALGSKWKKSVHSFDGGPLPPLYLGRHWRHSHDGMDQVFPPLLLHAASDQKLDGRKAWEQGYSTRLQMTMNTKLFDWFATGLYHEQSYGEAFHDKLTIYNNVVYLVMFLCTLFVKTLLEAGQLHQDRSWKCVPTYFTS